METLEQLASRWQLPLENPTRKGINFAYISSAVTFNAMGSNKIV